MRQVSAAGPLPMTPRVMVNKRQVTRRCRSTSEGVAEGWEIMRCHHDSGGWPRRVEDRHRRSVIGERQRRRDLVARQQKLREMSMRSRSATVLQ
jgi:hypothetical protein